MTNTIQIDADALDDEFDKRGWSDGLPIVAPTRGRVDAMLAYSDLPSDYGLGTMPPRQGIVTPEILAVNAVMAGCRSEYFPVVLAAVEAMLEPIFNLFAVQATTHPCAPCVIVNGPIRKRLGMNSGRNALGQGHRANASIGRALQLVIRNVGGGRPGEIDRATLGNPGKLGFCIAEDEEGTSWTSLAEDLGSDARTDCLTLFPGEGPRTLVDQLYRMPTTCDHVRRMSHLL